MTLEKVCDWLRVSVGDDDEHILGLMAAVPSYIETTTGMTEEQQKSEPLAETVSKFILMQWYDVVVDDKQNIQRLIDSLLKVLTSKAKDKNG